MLHFGEPETPDPETVRTFLERIFTANARLEPGGDAEAVRRRSRELAEARAPGLLADYARIGGSPLHDQARAQARMLEGALADRGRALPVALGMQFTEPSIRQGLETLRGEDPDPLVLLPLYPLCGPSTTVAALETVARELEALGWAPGTREITGWHRHPGYERLRAAATRKAAHEAGLDLTDPSVRVVFSAHGTPMRYVREGSRYVEYVEDWCARQVGALGLDRWTLGYQNHSNRGVEWTAPSIERALPAASEVRRILVDPVSFMHEQSETLVELDIELKEHAGALGLEYARVPIPYASDAFGEVLADLVLAALGEPQAGLPARRTCQCRPGATVCFNGERAPVPAGIGSS